MMWSPRQGPAQPAEPGKPSQQTQPTHVGQVEAVRAFTRFYTGVLGVLDEGLLDTSYSVTEARVIFELAQRDGTDVAALRRELRVDAGYMSRIATRLEAAGLVVRERSDRDARRQVLRLTDAGRTAYATLDGRSADQVAGLLGNLTDVERRTVVSGMNAVRRTLGRDEPRSRMVVLRAPEAGDFGWVVSRHGALYSQEYGWDATFESLVARIVADYVDDHDPAREAAWIAEVDGEPAGCVFCVAKDETTAALRILLVEPAARGLGIGARLVDECVRFATRAGYDALTLWTNDVLTAARRIYEGAGFTLVEENRHHSFGHDLVGQNWVKQLRP